MDDPLSRALDEAPQAHDDEPHGDVYRHRTQHAPALGKVLESLRAQLVEAMALPFFDGGASVEMTPVTKHALSEMGAATITARKREPAYVATVAVEVRSDHDAPGNDAPGDDAPDAGEYQVRARAHLRCDDRRGPTEREVIVSVREVEGLLRLDAPRLRDEIAAAIRLIGKASLRNTPSNGGPRATATSFPMSRS